MTAHMFKRNFLTALLVVFASFAAISQNQYAEVIIEQAKESTEALKSQDFEAVLKYMHPNIIALGGGRELMTQVVKDQLKMYKEQNFKVERVEFGQPSKLMQSGNELQCILPQKLILDFEGKEAEAPSKLFAASRDEGKTWQFADLNQYDEQSLKVFFPNFSEELLAELEKN